ncbi:hypothetical protein Sru01_64950 [Sphaerisporangium rufum]|uniref:Uncharacterized protein n=1 Tax=Sphaerisporangium rufum TaxID=1381558 RepID=A0A919R956_9ACTN|nr:hypothetical protein Sru01_64950 [Sphaerisporangium rufum]
MPDDLSCGLGDERKPPTGADAVAQGVDQVGHDSAVIAERAQMGVAYGVRIIRSLFTDFHARRLDGLSRRDT